MDSSSSGDSNPISPSSTSSALDGELKPEVRITPARTRNFRLLYEKRIVLFAILAALPGVAFGTSLIWTRDWTRDVKVSLTVLEFFLWLVLTLALLDQIVRPLQTLANVVGALREEDYSFAPRGAAPNDALGELALEINSLADILTEQRIQTIEATALLRRVVEEIDTPLFTFDPDHVLRLMNAACRAPSATAARAAAGQDRDRARTQCLLRRQKRNAGLASVLGSERALDGSPAKRSFRQNWRCLTDAYRRMSDVSRALREEERNARQRLIRDVGGPRVE